MSQWNSINTNEPRQDRLWSLCFQWPWKYKRYYLRQNTSLFIKLLKVPSYSLTVESHWQKGGQKDQRWRLKQQTRWFVWKTCGRVSYNLQTFLFVWRRIYYRPTEASQHLAGKNRGAQSHLGIKNLDKLPPSGI